MVKTILSVVLGYLFVMVWIILTFLALFIVLGQEGTFISGSFEVTNTWIAATFFLGFIGAVGAGFICRSVSKSYLSVKILAGVLLLLGVASAIATVLYQKPTGMVRVRTESDKEALLKSVNPTWVDFVNPVLGTIGVVIGGSIRRKR